MCWCNQWKRYKKKTRKEFKDIHFLLKMQYVAGPTPRIQNYERMSKTIVRTLIPVQ